MVLSNMSKLDSISLWSKLPSKLLLAQQVTRHFVRLGFGALAAAVGVAIVALPSTAAAQSRGEMLYSNHCLACHTTQMHWRDNKIATDWNSLKAQVKRWQAVASLGWSEQDILDVTRYLNDRYYEFAPTGALRGAAVPPPGPSQQLLTADRKAAVR